MGLFGGGTKQSGAQASGAAGSGYGDFSPSNNISFDEPLFDYTDPMQLAGLLVVLAAGWIAWKKLKVN